MNDSLRRELDSLAVRYYQLRRSVWLMAGCLLIGMVGVAILIHAGRGGQSLSLHTLAMLIAAAAGWYGLVRLIVRRPPSHLQIARRLEQKYPDLNARLLTAVEQAGDPDSGRLNVFQQQVVHEALDHARRERWAQLLPMRVTLAGEWGKRLALGGLFIIGAAMLLVGPAGRSASDSSASANAGDVRVEPGNTSVERGTGLLVLARFGGQLPSDVRLVARDGKGRTQTLVMSKSLDDPVFAARVPNVKGDLQYAVQYPSGQTTWFDAKVFDYPELKRADADLRFPGFTGQAQKHVEDVRSVTVVEGTNATFSLHLNKPVAQAELRPADGPPILLTSDPKQPDVVTATLTLTKSQSLKLKLTDADGRSNKEPAAELAINVNPNRPPELKPVTPGRDVDVSPIQELSTGVRVFDDFGVRRVGITYGIAGRPTEELTLASNVPGGKKLDVKQLISLEQAKAKPDELLTYYFWAEDATADGEVRRTSGDMYFAEVRPFEEIYRQGEQPSEGQQQQQQQQGGGSGQQAEQLADLQKQIIAATWKVIRRETAAVPSESFAPDVKLLQESQASARERAAALEERLTDARSRGYLKSVLDYMDRAVARLESAREGKSAAVLQSALSEEQGAYQALLRLRAREFEVTRSNQQQQGSSSSSSSRRQQQLDQMELNQEQNRYQTQRSPAPQTENPAQRETRQVLNRLKELAQRQEDLNRQMQELKSALEQARDEKQREELQRQLARLRDQQEQQLRDTDELRDRMEKPENQESMAEARQQMEQTRENVRRAAEQLQQQQVAEASASGARAGEQLNNLRDQVRRQSSGQLAQAMTDMRQAARELDDKQQQLSERMKQLNGEKKPSLRDGDDRKELSQQLGEQKQQLDQLTDAIKKTVDEAESSEPLVSKQLYDTLRQNSQRQTDEALDASRQLLDRGFNNEARQAEAEAGKGITQLRQGVEQAATSVLGDEAEALRRARAELDRLANDLQKEVDRNNPGGRRTAGSTTRPTANGLAGGPSTRPVNTGRLASGAATRPSDNAARASNRQGNGEQRPATQPREQLAMGPNGAERDERTPRNGQPGPDGQPNPTGRAGEPSQPGEERNRPDGGANAAESDQAGRSGNEQDQTNPQAQPGGQPNNRPDGQTAQPGQRAAGSEQTRSARAGEQGGPSQSGGQEERGEAPGTDPSGQSEQQSQPREPTDQKQNGNGQGASRKAAQPSPSPGQPGQGGLRGRSGQGQGGQAEGDQPQNAERADRPQQADDRQNSNRARSGPAGADATGGETAHTGDNDNPANGPLTGDNFQAWSDRLRDVEEMITDPKLRDRAARIRERARDLRADLKKHAKQPNWDVVQNTVGTPLAELRDEVAMELLRKQSPDALVPLDKDSVPPQYAEPVKRYYERLGAGR